MIATETTERDTVLMDRLDLSRRLGALLDQDEIIVAGIGFTSFDLFGAGHRPQNFYMLGSMGLAVPIGLGVALARPEREVFVLEGDGSMLMDLGALATVAQVAPPNLTIVVWDNGAYVMTGAQETATSGTTDLVQVARGVGIARSDWATDEADFERLVQEARDTAGPRLIAARLTRTSSSTKPEMDPAALRYRFMSGIGPRPGSDHD